MEKTTPILYNGEAIDYLNDIEFYDGYLLANIYLTSSIGVIDLDSGEMMR